LEIAWKGSSLDEQDDAELLEIPGAVPDLRRSIAGCVFAARCGETKEICRQAAVSAYAVATLSIVAKRRNRRSSGGVAVVIG